MNFYFGLGFLITVYILFLIWLFRARPTDLKVGDLKISKKKFVLIILQWCSEHLGTINQPYQLKLHYYKHQKYGGWYIFDFKMIRIYVYNDLTLIDLVDVIIHEYTHHLQFEKKNSQRDFQKLLDEVGYWENPFEVEAREIARRNRKECLVWILRHNQLF